MGNEVSGQGDYYDGDEDDYAKQFDGIETLGYRVLGVQPDSPASKAGLVSFFDFIVGANHKMLLGSGVGLEEGEEYDDIDFPMLLRDNLHKPVLLLVYNIKAREQREVQLIPSDDWGGAGLLGVTIKLDDYGGADEKLVRVLEVDEDGNGPGKQAGLIPQEDFLLGTTATTLTNTDVLASLLHMHLEQVVELYVYNSTTDLVRIVGLHPTYQWGYGESMLGAAVGTGYLHRLPESCRSTIGKSVERTVSIMEEPASEPNQLSGGVGELNLNQSNIRMEGTLEMEVEEEDGEAVDGDVGLAARGMQVQPHRLGQPQTTTTTTTTQAPPMDPPDETTHVPPPQAEEPPATPVTKALPPAPQETPLPFPEAAPLPPSEESVPSFSTPQPVPPPPPPPVSPTQVPPPPPPPPAEPETQQQQQQLPPPPPPPPPTTSPDPPASNDDDDDDDEYTDEEGSEYTDGSEYTEDEEPETPEAPRSGGLFGFMAPPPKMNY